MRVRRLAIDFVLMSKKLAAGVREVRMDYEDPVLNAVSDHIPVVVTLRSRPRR